jgi:hypothetical protein
MLGETKTYILGEADGAGGYNGVLGVLEVPVGGLFFLSSGSCCSVSGMGKEEQKENKGG